MPNKERSKSRIVTYLIIVFIIILIIIVGIGEIIIRINSEESHFYKKAILDKELGWVTTAYFDSEYEETDKAGVKYPVHYKTSKNGFRIYGDINTSKKRVFFVGDSYIQSVEVSNDKLFYKILADSLKFEVWAYGQAGYGTLQEKIIIEKFIKEIKPDLVVLQTCDNDFIDNYASLEYYSGYKVGLRRPYQKKNGEIVYRLPIPIWQEFTDRSKFLKLLRKKIQTSFPSIRNMKTETRIPIDHRKYKDYSDCLDITSDIINEIKNIVGDKKLLGFSASSYQPQLSDFNSIFRKNDIPFVSNIGQKLDTLTWGKKIVNSSDGYHWNEFGHKIVAKSLKDSVSLMLFH